MTEREQTIVYPVYEGLYVNLTSRCSCACTFCIRQSASGVGLDGNGGANNLWLDHEPSFEEVMAAIEEQDMSRYREQRQELSDPNQMAAAARDTREQPRREPFRAERTVGRNDPCPCGSGKKFKNCHGRNL